MTELEIDKAIEAINVVIDLLIDTGFAADNTQRMLDDLNHLKNEAANALSQ